MKYITANYRNAPKIITLCFTLMFFCALSHSISARQQPSIEGYWEGAMVRGGAVQILRVEFFNDAGKMKAKFQIPDWSLSSPATLNVKYEHPKVVFYILYGDVEMTADSEIGEMTGTVGNAVPPISIHLKRAIKPAEIPVKEEEIKFSSGDLSLAGTLITPAASGRHPAVVWISGRGGTVRDDFARARIFARRGIASLIYDKRGNGGSTGNFAAATMSDLAADAQAAVQFLATHNDINPRQIGVHGHSAGGWVAAIVAARSKVPLAFVVTSVGPAESVRNQQIHASQYRLRFSDAGYTEDEIALAGEHIGKRMRVVFKNEGLTEYQASVEKVKSTRVAGFLIQAEKADADDIDWLRRNEYDPAPDLKKIAAPFLAFYGARDSVVPPEENVKKLEGYLTEAGNKDFKIVVLPGVDHSLYFAGGVRKIPETNPENYQWLWRKISPNYLDTMLEWVLARVTTVSGNNIEIKK